MANNSTNQVKKLFEYTLEELKGELKSAVDSGNFAKAQEISKELLDRENIAHAKVEFDEKQKDMLKKISEGKASPDEVKEFVTNDLQNYQSETDTRIKNVEEFKDKKIKELEKQLKDEKNEKEEFKQTLTDLPGLTDYFSLERRRFVKLAEKIDDLKKDSRNYPKNMLIYCMASTNKKFFGTREAIKRNRIKLFWKRKDTEIVKELETIKDKLAPRATDKIHRKLLKEMLLKEIEEAQVKYYEQLKNNIV